MRLLYFFLSHSIFIAFCAVGLSYQTMFLLHIEANFNVLGFIFFSTLCSYNFYWLLSNFYFSKKSSFFLFLKNKISFISIFLIGSFGVMYFMLHLKNTLPYILVAVLLTLLYTLPLWPFNSFKRLQKVGFFKTILLSFTWTYVTTILPAINLLYTHTLAITVLFTLHFFFMMLLCILFDLRDISIDKIHGLHSLATDMAPKKMNGLLIVIYTLYIVTALCFCFTFGNLTLAFAFIFMGMVLWIVYVLSLSKRGYVFYYFLVDGLMLLSALSIYIANRF
jgi:4-hydroxybenzoate polyprenyltransferase